MIIKARDRPKGQYPYSTVFVGKNDIVTGGRQKTKIRVRDGIFLAVRHPDREWLIGFDCGLNVVFGHALKVPQKKRVVERPAPFRRQFSP